MVKCRIVYEEGIKEIGYLPYSMREIRTLRMAYSDEIDYTYKQYGMNFYCFGDLTFMSNREHIHAICKELILRGLNHIPWWCQTTVGSLNEDDLKLMKQAGCRQIGLGVENGVQENLDIMG